MVNDIISDSITRIRNASMRKLEHTNLYYAKIVVSILLSKNILICSATTFTNE